MGNSSVDKLYNELNIEELRKDDVKSLREKVDLLHRALVDIKATQVAQNILAEVHSTYGVDEGKVLELTRQLEIALSVMRSRLRETSIPEDAYLKWRMEIRHLLRKVVSAEQLDILIPRSFSWDELFTPPTE